jgi:hypothetical protein
MGAVRWVVGRIQIDRDEAGASMQPLRMTVDHAVGQCLS